MKPGETITLKAASEVDNLHFWSWGYGYLYTVKTSLWVDGRKVDEVATRTGFRKTRFGKGMIWLNDRVIQMKGFAQRTSNEWPGVGMSVPAWLSDYSNHLMVEGNANLVRWMHVTPWKQDIESCDRVGLIQAMQAGDAEKDCEGRQWEQRTELMRDAIIYNRNNPSILFYECGNESISREIGVLSALNYSYDDRYLADLSWRASASSRFGQDKRWGQFWSAGIGWNFHKEHFMEQAEWLKQFKLRASTGYTGAQNFNPYQALAMFSYNQTQAYDNWIGSHLMALPNDDLKWQKTQDYNIGFDLNLWGRLMIVYDYYVQQTKDQLLALTVPPSMGFTSYMENIGSTENKGMELKLNAHLLYDVENDRYLSTSFSIAKNTNKLKKISNALRSYNDEVDNEILDGNTNRPQTRFIEGSSMNAIWAVRSLGIDPATGDEIFLTKDGETTTEWKAEDQVVCGDAMPECSGTFGINMDYRGIFLNMSFYYQFGGQTYNQTLVDRVENADVGLNVDKRIYNAVWKKPGDRVDFSYNPYRLTKPSSRFVQDLNELRLSSLNVGYDFRHCAFLKKSRLQQLKASFYMDDVFRASTVKTERGLTYPFARTFSFSLQATF